MECFGGEMGFFNPDPLMLALVTGTVFFVLLGILVLFIKEIEFRVLVGILCLLIGVALLLFALGGADVAIVVIAVMMSLIINEVLGRMGIVS